MDIDISRAKTGMSLNRDVIDRQGHVLLRSGISLTQRHLDLIKAHGIQRIDVGADRPPTADRPPRQPAPPERLFRNQDLQHPLIRELLRVCKARHAHTTENQP